MCTSVTKRTGIGMSVLWAILVSWAPESAAEQPHSNREDQLKAGYIFNFAKFVDWPNLATNDTLTICFLGGTGMREAFVDSSGGKPIGIHPVIVRAVGAPMLRRPRS
jgi:hypothetical protein